MKRDGKNGFTLIEVLVVIAIIALLAALILGLAGNAQKSAARNKALAEVTQLEAVITDYQMKYGQVPKTRQVLMDELEAQKHPLAEMMDPWGMPYEYESSSGATFFLWSKGGDTAGNTELYIGNSH